MKYDESLYGGISFPFRKALQKDAIIKVFAFGLPIGAFISLGWKFGVLIVGFVILFVIVYALTVIYEYLDFKYPDMEMNEIIFYDMNHFYAIGWENPINDVYKDHCDDVFRIYFRGKGREQSKSYRFRCIMTEPKLMLMKDVLFPISPHLPRGERLGSVKLLNHEFFCEGKDFKRRKTSFPFKVTYTKYNHYIVSIELLDDVEYPEDIPQKVERLNRMF